MAIGIDPKIDFVFKRVLGNPDYPDVTLHFLNSLLDGSPRITAVDYTNPFLDKKAVEDKLAVLDVLATDEHGRHIDIEMQTSLVKELPQRLTWYLSSMYTYRIMEGQNYRVLRPAICICVLDDVMFPETTHFHSEFRLRTLSGDEFTDHLQVHLLELPKYTPADNNSMIEDPIEQWCYFFQNGGDSTTEQLTDRLSEQALTQASGVLDMIQRTPEEQLMYEFRMKQIRDMNSRVDEGVERGILIGTLQTLQQVAGESVSTHEQLGDMSVKQLEQQIAEVREKLNNRG